MQHTCSRHAAWDPLRAALRPPRTGATGGTREERDIGISLPNSQRQHRALHIQKDVLPYEEGTSTALGS